MAKVMIVTGGSRGIGAATARLAVAQGYDVALAYAARAAEADAMADDVRAAGQGRGDCRRDPVAGV